MPAIVSMLRGVNVGAHHRISMAALRELYEKLGLQDARTYVQSGNVVFKTAEGDLPGLARLIEDAIEQAFNFHADIILRTTAELRDVIAKNPFRARENIDPGKLLVLFLAGHASQQGRERVRGLNTGPEELYIGEREIYIYFPNGMGRSKLPWASLETVLKTPSTGRNWNSVTKLLKMAEEMESEE